ncbi:MAG TPA: mannose-6-phosphate isomerase, class I [Actinobacteria bacterium]|jgi:mannose-6-phosphate isomerase|nr:mannose-6-phosphate isomerase, class I [Actinomycetota bacterium]
MLIVRGAIKDYDWGVIDGLQPWSGQATGAPQAELWFGVHPGGPSPLVDTGGEPTGELLADHFDIEAIPLLVKLLAAARPLSVQVHPPRLLAESGWRQQQAPGSLAVYSDPFEKTEMLVALQDFEAFAGWRSEVEAAAILSALGISDQIVAAVRMRDRATAIRGLLEASSPARIGRLAEAAEAAGLAPEQVAAYATVTEHYPDDRGALLTPMLAYLSLQPGEAVYVPAGVPHSYIRGIGLEVMTSSDNVIRLGLTGKPVFVDQAIAALDDKVAPQMMATRHGDLIWPVNAPFVVRMLQSGGERIPSGAYRILLLIEGSARVESEFGEIVLRPGTAAVISADDPDSFVAADGLVAIVQSTSRQVEFVHERWDVARNEY